GADDVRDAVDEHLGLLAPVLAVAEAERVSELVDQRADLPVGGAGSDDDLPVLAIAPSARAVVREFAALDAVAQLASEVVQRGDQVLVAVAFDRLRRRRERDRLD